MRNLHLIVLCTGLALVAPSLLGCAGVQRLDTRGAPTFTLAETRDPTAGPRVTTALGGAGLVLKLRAGEALPVQLSSRLGVAHLTGGAGHLTLDRDAYVYLSGRRALIGPDGQRWARLGDWRTLRRLFGLRRGGTFQVGLGITQGTGAKLTLALDARN